jgi:hypothetical protein
MKRTDKQGKLRLSVNKNNTGQTDNGYAGEDVALELIKYCLDCDCELRKENPCTKGSDLYCLKCNSKYQVKTYGPGNHNQLTDDNILKQAGPHEIMVETMTKSKLRYVVLFYDKNKDVVRSVLSSKVKPSDIVSTYGIDKKKCRINLKNVFVVDYE